MLSRTVRRPRNDVTTWKSIRDSEQHNLTRAVAGIERSLNSHTNELSMSRNSKSLRDGSEIVPSSGDDKAVPSSIEPAMEWMRTRFRRRGNLCSSAESEERERSLYLMYRDMRLSKTEESQ